MKRRLSNLAVISSCLAVSLPIAGLCQDAAPRRPAAGTQAGITKSSPSLNLNPVTSTQPVVSVGGSGSAAQTNGIGVNTKNSGLTTKTNLPAGSLTSPQLGGAGSQEKLDLGRGALGNKNLGQLNQKLNQIEGLSQQAIQDGNPVGNSIGTAATFQEFVDGSTTLKEETVNSSESHTHNNGKSSSITFEEVQAQEKAAAGEGGASLAGFNSLIELENTRLDSQQNNSNNGSSDGTGASESSESTTNETGGGPNDGIDGGKPKDDDGSRLGIFQDPSKGSGGIGVQNSIELQSENLAPGVSKGLGDVTGNLQNQVDRVGSGNLLRRGVGNVIDTAGGEVRSLRPNDGGAGRISPFAAGGSFKQGFNARPGVEAGGNIPNFGAAKINNVGTIPGRIPTTGIDLPSLGAGKIPNLGGGTGLGAGRLPGSAGLPGGAGSLPGVGRLPSAIPSVNAGRIPINLPSFNPAGRVPTGIGAGINLPARVPIQTSSPQVTPSFTPAFNAGAGRLPTQGAGAAASSRAPLNIPGKVGR